MTTLQEFHLFSSLPPELRLLVWEEALTDSGLWAPATTCKWEVLGKRGLMVHKRRDPQIRMKVYPWSSPTRFACRESWYLSQHLRPKEFEMKKDGTKNRFHWMDLKRNVIHLGNVNNASEVIYAMTRDELALITHLVIQWTATCGGLGILLKLRFCCPGLRTVIFQDMGFEWDPVLAPDEDPPMTPRLLPEPDYRIHEAIVSPELAKLYMALTDPAMPLVSHGPIRHEVRRNFLHHELRHLEEPLRIHFVTPREVFKDAVAETDSSLSTPDPERLL